MERQEKNSIKSYLLTHVIRLALIFFVLVAAVFTASGGRAWFSLNKKYAAGIADIGATTIYINAGNRDDIVCIDLGNIDKEAPAAFITEGTGAAAVEYGCYDVPFCVQGDSVTYYRLQLAFTTNNQFEYLIYPASTTNPGSSVVSTIYKPASGDPITYYSTADPLVGEYLNKGSWMLANDSKHTATYDSYSSDYVQKYAEPIYWRTIDQDSSDGGNDIAVTNSNRNLLEGDPSTHFCHYYILRVIWKYRMAKTDGEGHIVMETVASRDKETDVIYIVAVDNTIGIYSTNIAP